MSVVKEVEVVVGDITTRPKEFREQVQRLRRMREKMRADGVSPEDKQFAAPLKERLDIVPRLRFWGFEQTNDA